MSSCNISTFGCGCGFVEAPARKEENNEDGDKNKSIIGQMKETRRERSKSNQMMMNSRNNDGGSDGKGGDGDVNG